MNRSVPLLSAFEIICARFCCMPPPIRPGPRCGCLLAKGSARSCGLHGRTDASDRSLSFDIVCRDLRGIADTAVDALSDPVVPFLLGPSVEDRNEKNGHVIASNTAPVAVWRNTLVHHELANLVELELVCDAPSDKVDGFLVLEYIPDTVTCDDEELVFLRRFVLDDIGVGCYNLLLCGQVLVLLEFKVSECAREGQVACRSGNNIVNERN